MTIDKLREAYESLAEFGCTDGGCLLRHNRGMVTNGGCKCLHYREIGGLENAGKARAIARVLLWSRELLKETVGAGE